MLALNLFYPAADKVRQVEFHPVLPWVVSTTKSDNVSVWDWRTRQLVWETQLGGSDDDLCMDAEWARLHNRDPAFTPNPSLLHPIPSGAKKEPTGHVKDVRFLDCDVAQVQLTWQHMTVAGCGTPPPRADDIKALRGQRLLVIACECKVVVVDLASRRVLELGKGAFEGKSPSSLAFLFRTGPTLGSVTCHAGVAYGASNIQDGTLLESPILAVGCSDGIVRCVQLFPIKPVARLISGHKTPVVAMAVLSMRGHRHDTLAVGHQSGRVVLYEPLGPRSANSAAAGNQGGAASMVDGVGPRDEYKAHERELLPGSLVVVPIDEDPESIHFRLFSAGSDNRVCGLDPAKGTSSEVVRTKVDGTTLTCMAHWPRGFMSNGVYTLLMGTESGSLLLAHANGGEPRQAVNLNGLIPAGQKRMPKVYGIHVHPRMPSIVAAATNAGTAILAVVSPHQPLPVASLPLEAPSQALRDDGAAALGLKFSGGGGGVTYVTAMGTKVICVTASTLPNQDLTDFPLNQVMGKLEVVTDAPISRPLVTVSHNGGYVAVAWPGARRYAVYQQGAAAWKEVAQGTGTAVAWHSSRAVFAALEEDAPVTRAITQAPDKRYKDPRKSEKHAAMVAAAAEAAARAAAASATIRIKQLHGDGGEMALPLRGMSPSLDLRGDIPSFVQGGPLLAVTVRRALQSEAPDLAPSGSFTPALLLFDWETGRRVGPELPEPLHLSWDPSRTMLAMAYTSQLLIVRARPEFQVAVSLPVCGAESLEWSARQLFIATSSHIMFALVSPFPPLVNPSTVSTAAVTPPAAPPARLITLAGPGVCAGGSVAGGALAQEGFLPAPAIRPPGPLVLLGPRDGCLWMVGVLGQPFALGLSHPGLRCCSMVAAGDLHGAVSLASRALAPNLHDELASLMLDMDGQRAAAAAVNLPGISLQTQLRLRVALRHWQQAVEAADALLLGYTVRPPPGQFCSSVATVAFANGHGGGDSFAYGGGGGIRLGDDFVDLSMAEGGAPANAPAHPEDLDWTEPLRTASSSARAAATAVVASRAPGRDGPSVAGGGPTADTVQLVLGLMEDLQRAGSHDVVRHLVKPLLVNAVFLGGDQLRTLGSIMAQVGMNVDLPSLLHSVAPGADSSGREAAALLAAMLSGHTALVQDSLREDGAKPLAALQARVYGLSSAADSMAVWRRQLAAASPLGTAAALGRLEVSDPLPA
ncbi:hypothetical protein VaNZ11_000129 [Volvox africanus]|uniref:Uncharacterized protein n=1 Tax=Volvox africanus TaxID=51714 RepID=A0ABQ5RLA2_9CHLO|nr:hypothetical protein VaNZ11_000129 [Volvox africanus]